ncbi:CHASE domain-containing protein [Massilia forsythiae]|nr:CHASE domain-containing protein [Massilia forsythiae]
MPHPHQPPVPSTDRPALRGRAFVPFLLAAFVLLVSLGVTWLVAANARHTARSELENTFHYRARDLERLMADRMAVYEQVLQGTRGFLRGSVDISRADFAQYYGVLRLNERFPGFEALGIATIVDPARLAAHEAQVRAEGYPGYAVTPAGRRDLLTAIAHIQPLTRRNLRAFGYDMYSEPTRRAAMDAARDTGRAASTAKLTLVQEGAAGDSAPQSGFLMYVPVYRAGQAHATVEQRRAAIVGWVYAPFRTADLMHGLGGEHAADLEVALYDGRTQAVEALLYRSGGAAGAGVSTRRPLFARNALLDNAGRPWTLAIRSSPAFEAGLERGPGRAIAFGGAGLGLLLAFIVWLLATERRRALQLAGAMTVELRASRDRIDAERARIRLILQNAYDAFVAVDPSGCVTDWNAQACALFGWKEEEALGRDAIALLVPAGQREEERACLKRFAASGACARLSGPYETTALDRHGQEIPVEVAITALPTARGHGVTAFVRDIRPRRDAEARERHRQQRLDEARGALLRSQKLEAVGKLTGGVAHDFNNILHIISVNVQLMLRHGEGERKRLLGIGDAVERGKKLSAQLLAFARRQPLHPSVVSLAQLIERMDTLLHRAAGDAIAIRFAIPPGLWHALVDPNQLENVLLNLVINARDAMDGQGSIVIALDNLAVAPGDALADTGIAPGEFVTVAVRDTGSGMPPDVMERAFEPFFTTKPEGKGTGLGLSMAHGFAEQSGGHIRLASTPGAGTTVTLYLPRALQETADPLSAPAPH